MKPKHRVVIVFRCRDCGFKFVVMLNKHAEMPAPPRIAGVAEKFRTCPKCGKQFESPRVVDARWS